MYSVRNNCPLRQLGFPIRKSPDQRLLTAPRGSIVVRHVLHRLLVPRHPPCALISLTYSVWQNAASKAYALLIFSFFSSNVQLNKSSRKRKYSLVNISKDTLVSLNSNRLDDSLLSYPVFKVQMIVLVE